MATLYVHPGIHGGSVGVIKRGFDTFEIDATEDTLNATYFVNRVQATQIRDKLIELLPLPEAEPPAAKTAEQHVAAGTIAEGRDEMDRAENQPAEVGVRCRDCAILGNECACCRMSLARPDCDWKCDACEPKRRRLCDSMSCGAFEQIQPENPPQSDAEATARETDGEVTTQRPELPCSDCMIQVHCEATGPGEERSLCDQLARFGLEQARLIAAIEEIEVTQSCATCGLKHSCDHIADTVCQAECYHCPTDWKKRCDAEECEDWEAKIND